MCRFKNNLLFLALAASLVGCEQPEVDKGTSNPIIVEIPSWNVHPSDVSNARFGESLSGGIDTNGDGYDDVIAAAPRWGPQIAGEGRVYVFSGSERGLPTRPSWLADPTDGPGASFGRVAALGDVNADGYGDFAVLSSVLGVVYVYTGGPDGPTDTPTFLAMPNGTSIAAAGDVNGDGYADMIVGTPSYSGEATGEGQATLLFGSADGSMSGRALLDPTDQANANFGAAVSSAGDINGDGFGDIAIGASSWDGEVANEGRVYVYFGSAGGPVIGWTMDPTNQSGSTFGSSVASGGDIDGDGYSDLVVGSPTWSDTVLNRGRVYVYPGGPGDSSPVTRLVWLSPVDQQGALFGNAVAGVSDVNGDGYSDIAIGARGFDAGEMAANVGKVLLYLGGEGGLDIEIGGAAELGADEGSQFGFSVAFAGDVNGDGLGDIIAGAPQGDGGVANEGQVLGFYGEAPMELDAPVEHLDREFQQAEELDGVELERGDVTTGTTAVLSAQALLLGPVGGRVRLEVELKEIDVPFDGTDLVLSEPVIGGATASVVYSDLTPAAYHWRARTVYPVGTGRGQWLSYADEQPVVLEEPIVEDADAGPIVGLDAGVVVLPEDDEVVPDFIVEAPVIVVPKIEKKGHYDCRIAAAGSSRGFPLSFLFGALVLLVAFRRPGAAQ